LIHRATFSALRELDHRAMHPPSPLQNAIKDPSIANPAIRLLFHDAPAVANMNTRGT
jgi:hypothetical protein